VTASSQRLCSLTAIRAGLGKIDPQKTIDFHDAEHIADLRRHSSQGCRKIHALGPVAKFDAQAKAVAGDDLNVGKVDHKGVDAEPAAEFGLDVGGDDTSFAFAKSRAGRS